MNIKIRFIIMIVLSLIIALLINYDCPYCYRVFGFYVRREIIHIFVSFATVGSIFLAYKQWRQELEFQKKTDINGLFEELRHNINIINETYLSFDKKVFFKSLSKQLDMMGDKKIYTNPTDSKELQNKMWDEFIKKEMPKTRWKLRYMPLRDTYIQKAVSSKNIFSLSNNRIFLNLGHLYFSITRYNFNIATFNSIEIEKDGREFFNHMRNEYVLWLHFRLFFMYIDLIKNTPTSYFVDDQEIENIKNLIS